MKVLCKKKITFQRRDEVAMSKSIFPLHNHILSNFLIFSVNSYLYLVEKDILQKANHPFIPKLVYFFENERNFFLVVEYIEGGEQWK